MSMLKGVAVSEGYGIGSAVVLPDVDLDYSAAQFEGMVPESQRLQAAVDRLQDRLSAMAERIEQRAGPNEAAILRGHLALLQDPDLHEEIAEQMGNGWPAEAALDRVCKKYIEVFNQSEDVFFRQRGADIRDLRQSLLMELLGKDPVRYETLPAGTVLVARELTPSVVARLGKGNVTGLVSENGGFTSHSAILARAMGIPAIMAVPSATAQIKDGDQVVVDCTLEAVCLNPTKEELASYRARETQFYLEQKTLQRFLDCPTVTLNGIEKAVYANLSKPEDVSRAIENGAEGIGLFRTESLFQGCAHAPTEDGQFRAYASVVQAMKGKEVVIRILDTSGEKSIPALRGKMRPDGLVDRSVLKTQIRAILRASEFGKVKIMIPMVHSPEEVLAVKQIVSEATVELRGEGKHILSIPVGAMIETPEALECLPELARACAFFSIGANDLTSSLLHLERDKVHVYNSLDPTVTSAIAQIIRTAKAAKIPVSACGAFVTDPRLIYHLLLWGLDVFSVSAESILKTRKAISQLEA